ncbi:MAG: cyclic nucleotide-binding domain-containing protein [Ilumatobacteraceae bacterium]
MRVEGSATTISWIPSEAVTGLMKTGFVLRVSHYDNAPPDHLNSGIRAHLEELRVNDGFRFANHLPAWAEFADDGTFIDAGHGGGGLLGATHLRLGGDVAVAAVAMPDLRPEPETGPGWVRFTQTAGGSPGVPMPRPVRRAPFVQFRAPVAWSTLEVTLHADGRVEGRLAGASPFPRHWVYDTNGALSAKSGTTDWKDWTASAFGKGTPWGEEDSPAFVTEVESALERELSGLLMRGAAKPKIRRFKEGQELTRKGDRGDQLFLLLDGVLVVDVDGKELAEVGPGAVLGERAILENGVRTSTLIARTNCKIAVVPADQLDRDRLAELAAGHRREDTDRPDDEVDLLTAANAEFAPGEDP